MAIEFTPRTKTELITISIRTNQPDIGIYNLDIMNRRLNRRMDSGYHFVVRHNGDIEKGRPHQVVGGFFPNRIDINVICKGYEMTDVQTQTVRALTDHLKTLYPEATSHYAYNNVPHNSDPGSH